MTNENNLGQQMPVPTRDYANDITQFETVLVSALGAYGLPSQDVLVNVSERARVFKNVPEVVELLSEEKRGKANYISKFIAASASGLFDAALNYLWDETIYELRARVTQYDINYFYDIAVESSTKRKSLKDEADLDKITDAELIKGANEIGIISDIGYKHLDYIKYMRNWASAAHPNHNEISGLQLIAMLETCIREVINLPISNIAVEIKRLLSNIKENNYSQQDINGMAAFLKDATQVQVNTLGQGLYGLYTHRDTNSQTTQNINLLIPHVWKHMDDEAKRRLGVKLATSIANGDAHASQRGRAFFNLVSGMSFVPEGILVAEISTAIQDLYNAHHSFNNFHNEPAFARNLARIVGDAENIPSQIERPYVFTIVDAFLTNGNGVAVNAEPIYRNLIEKFNERQALLALTSYTNSAIASKFQFSRSRSKFIELLDLVRPKFTNQAAIEFVDFLKNGSIPLDKINNDSNAKRTLANLQQLLDT